MEDIGVVGTRVGVNGATMVRGDRGGDVGGVVVVCMEDILVIEGIEAERGLQESLRRQLGCMLDMIVYRESETTRDIPFTAIENRVGGDGDLFFAHGAKIEETGSHIKVGFVVPVPAHASRVTGPRSQLGDGHGRNGSTTSV
jgi:hypothetical protein